MGAQEAGQTSARSARTGYFVILPARFFWKIAGRSARAWQSATLLPSCGCAISLWSQEWVLVYGLVTCEISDRREFFVAD